MFKEVYVEMDGIDSNSGESVEEAFETIGAAYASLGSDGGNVRIGRGHYPIDTEIALTKPARFIGKGPDETFIDTFVSSGYAFQKSAGALVTNLSFEELCIDMQNVSNAAGLRFENANGVSIINCNFQNTGIWSVVFGASGATADTTTTVCEGALISGCIFKDAVSTYEALLIFNTNDVTVEKCTFEGIGDSAIGIGLYQNVRNIDINDCTFTSTGTGGVGMYYSFSCNDIRVLDCRFVIGQAIKGAMTSDHGAFSFTYVDNLHIQGCDVQNLSDTRGIELGATRNARVVSTVIHDSYGSGMWIDRGHSATGEGTHLSIGTRLIDCTIENNNQVNTFNALHPGVFILNDTLDQDIDLMLVETSIRDTQDSPTQTYAYYADPGVTGYRELASSVTGSVTGYLHA